MPRETLTITEAAELLGIGRNLAYQLAARDELPVRVLHLGRRLLVPRRLLLEAVGIGDAPANGHRGVEATDHQDDDRAQR